ncbi:nucleotidyl transferase AbiEii/AbiGii toxin family protein [archaeon]|nr:MAG: nucleotidyl transferase AbiEii/AbiGii toxin family protein [archaeon]
MISIEELKRIAKLKGIRNLGYAEKDYLIEIALLSISRNTKDELVFKGGTCLYKFHKLDRFSEDIDFTAKKEIDVDGLLKKITDDLASFGIEAHVKDKKKAFNSVMITIKAKGHLYNGDAKTFASIGVDINLKSSVDLEPVLAKYSPLYTDIPSFSLLVMREEEILAEKIRAIMSRTKARDVYDLWFLLKKGVKFDIGLVKKKLAYYKQEWNLEEFKKHINLKEGVWLSELKPLIDNVPEFREARDFILSEISKKKK